MTDEKPHPELERQGVEGLTEVLRLQAEALSRISERMSGARHPGATPGIPPVEPRRESGNLPVLAGDPALSGDSLPVLNSFKSFLEQERQMARRRLLWVILGFTGVFSAVLALLVWLNNERASGLEADLRHSAERSEQARQEADAGLKRLAAQSALTATQNVNQMRHDMARNILWAHSVIASNFTSELSGRDSELDRLKEKLASVEVENALLSRRLAELDDRLEQVESAAKERDAEDAIRAQINQQEATAAATARPVMPAPAAEPLQINSARYNRPLKLRMPGQ